MNFDRLLLDLDIPFKRVGEHHHARQGWLQLDCPYCLASREKYHLGYNIARSYMNCWKCGRHNLASTLATLANIPTSKARQLLEGVDRQIIKDVAPRGRLALPRGMKPLQPAHKKYLIRRGFDPAKIEALWDVRCFSYHRKYSWRLFIPIYHNDRIVSFTTRAIGDVPQRYLSAPADCEAIPHKHILYGADYVRHAVIVVEGPLDVWAIGPGCVGLCGTGFTRQQVAALAEYPLRAVCFDSSKNAQQRANTLCDMLSPFPGETYNVQLKAKDPAEASEREINDLRSKFLE